MLPSSLRPASLILLAAVALTACTRAPTLDASSYESLLISLNTAAETLPEKDRAAFAAARRQFNSLWFPNGGADDAPARDGLPDWRAVHGLRPVEFVRFVEQTARLLPDTDPATSTSLFPNPALAWRLLAQYRDELTLLTMNRQRQLDEGKSTIDQFPIIDVGYVPPLADVPLEYDHATFLISLRNDSDFDAYAPSVRIRLTDPAQPLPLFDRTFEHPRGREPMGPGEVLTMKFDCCQLIIDPIHNGLLKQASPQTVLEAELVSVSNHNSVPLLNLAAFSLRDSRRMRVLERCIARIEEDPAGWVPQAAADAPGGCGDGEQG